MVSHLKVLTGVLALVTTAISFLVMALCIYIKILYSGDAMDHDAHVYFNIFIQVAIAFSFFSFILWMFKLGFFGKRFRM